MVWNISYPCQSQPINLVKTSICFTFWYWIYQCAYLRSLVTVGRPDFCLCLGSLDIDWRFIFLLCMYISLFRLWSIDTICLLYVLFLFYHIFSVVRRCIFLRYHGQVDKHLVMAPKLDKVTAFQIWLYHKSIYIFKVGIFT